MQRAQADDAKNGSDRRERRRVDRRRGPNQDNRGSGSRCHDPSTATLGPSPLRVHAANPQGEKHETKVDSRLAVLGTAAATPALGEADANMITARQEVFGFENVDARTGEVDKNKVVFSSLGHISGAVSIGRSGHLVGHLRSTSRGHAGPHTPPDQVSGGPQIRAVFVGHGTTPKPRSWSTTCSAGRTRPLGLSPRPTTR